MTAGLLHDVLESSDTTAVELRVRFGPVIAGLVEAVSENPAVQDPVERKARLRRQVAAAGAGSRRGLCGGQDLEGSRDSDACRLRCGLLGRCGVAPEARPLRREPLDARARARKSVV